MIRILPILFSILIFQHGSARSHIHENSLAHYAKNIYSQRGEDGILEEILIRLDIKEGFFVEFGAWDGILLSNCRFLVEQGWRGLFIESDPIKYQELVRNYEGMPNITCLNYFVTYDEKDHRGKTIDRILQEHFPNQEIDFLSIDIDGADHLILENLECKPKILCVEGGFSWNPDFKERVPDHIAFQNLQQPLAIMVEIGKTKGYEPICFTQNTFFVKRDLSAPFEKITNDIRTLWTDGWHNLDRETQRWLLNFRATNPLIRLYEGPDFFDLKL